MTWGPGAAEICDLGPEGRGDLQRWTPRAPETDDSGPGSTGKPQIYKFGPGGIGNLRFRTPDPRKAVMLIPGVGKLLRGTFFQMCNIPCFMFLANC